ncbi:Tfp pilus assembly protein PilF [Terribacillus halophilus]|uniref:Tfp pilus assembly protein PilF n=1 Tax=Terribacillus halophilus TaxID=361279 RepID=A0A1G6THA1_9BACI|nr:tetratricopeptide repeat protein [Terribacillus halophilus]SDD27715.1 Tfp pilus assembly protein PilF [Terribacillus halophilus]
MPVQMEEFTALKAELQTGKAPKEVIRRLEDMSTGTDDSLRLRIYHLLAGYHASSRQYEQTILHCQRAIRLAEVVSGPDLSLIIDSYLIYAAMETSYKQTAAARVELAKLLLFLEKRQFKDAFVSGKIYLQLAKTAIAEEQIDLAIRELKESASFFKQAAADLHPAVQQVLHLLVQVYEEAGLYEEAQTLVKEQIKEMMRLQARKRELAWRIRQGELFFYTDLKKARRILSKALQLTEQADETELSVRVYVLLGEIDEEMRQFPRAISYYERARSAGKAADQLMSYLEIKIGLLAMKAGHIEKAKRYLENIPPHTPASIQDPALYALATLYGQEKEYGRGRHILKKLLSGRQEETKMRADALQLLASFEFELHHIGEAIRLFEDASGIYRKNSHHRFEQAMTMLKLGGSYEEIGDQKQAAICYEEAVAVMEKTRHRQGIEEALAQILRFYEKNENPLKRYIYENKLVKWQLEKIR